MKNAILSAISEIEKQCAKKRLCDRITPGSAEYYLPFEKLYEADRENFCPSLSELTEEAEAETLLHVLRLCAYFGVNAEALAPRLREVFKTAALIGSTELGRAARLGADAEELLKGFAGGTESVYAQKFYGGEGKLPSFEGFIALSEVTDIETAVLYGVCTELHIVPAAPKFIKDAMRASAVIDGLYGTLPWQYYLENTSAKKIARDISALEKVGFAEIPKMLSEFLEKFKCSKISSRKEKARFFEKLCLKNKDEIAKIMLEEENTIDKFIVFHSRG